MESLIICYEWAFQADILSIMTVFYAAHLFQAMPEGTRVSGPPWPSHVTLLPDFELEMSAAELIEFLDPLLNSLKQASTVVLYSDHFGPEQDMEVRLLEPTPSLMALHFLAADRINDNGREHFLAPKYSGFGYRPHISVVPGEEPAAIGTCLRIDTFSLHVVDPGDDSRSVIHTWQLQPPKGER